MELHRTRVRIRPWQRHDDDLASQWPPYNDPLDPLWNLPRQVGSLSDWYSSFDFGSMRRAWAIEDQVGHMIGRISLREIDDQRRRARLGISLGAPYVGQGLGTEALALFLDYYFGELGFQAMVLDVAAPNERAVRCYERLGFRHVGDDWRQPGSSFNPRLINQPRYMHLRRFFRQGLRGLEVLFFEMELPKETWQTLRVQFIH